MSRGAFANPPPSQRCKQSTECSKGIHSGDLTYHALGGTGLFQLGILDTHFSERNRETRLATFAASTQQRFGFGVDETTALLVDISNEGKSYDFKVIGQSGVFIFDHEVGHYSQTYNIGQSKKRIELSGVSHYITSGSSASYDPKYDWRFDLAGAISSKRQSLKPLKSGLWRDQVRSQCGSVDTISWRQCDNEYKLKASKNTLFHVEAKLQHCSYAYLPFLIVHYSDE